MNTSPDLKSLRAFYHAALLLLAVVSLGRAQTLPDLLTYTLSVAETKTLPGSSAAPGAPCNGTIAPADQIQDLALAALSFSGFCYTDGQYNHRNYFVERGTVSAAGGASNLAAYRIHEPQIKANIFPFSKHAIYYRFPTVENYTVYSLVGGALSKVAEVLASAIPNTTDFIPVPAANPITVSEVVGSIVYVFAPSTTPVSSFTALGAGVEGARVASTPFGDVLKYRYTVAGTPFDSALDFAAGPGDFNNSYSDTRRFFLVRNGNAGLGAVWQNQADSSLKLTWFGADRKSPTTVSLANPQAQVLACATGDDAGNVYFITIQPGSGAPNTPRNATLTKAGPTGATLSTTALDTSNTGLGMVEFFKVASLKYLNGKLALMLGRTMLQTGDGLNHQGGIAVIFDATTLAVDINWGQTSGHSFDNVLTSNTNGQFVAIDLGDNYPRGINLHKLSSNSRYSRVISSFKTEHGTSPDSPDGNSYPVYTEISGGGTTYYRWSNDNRTYTELGGLAQTSLGYAVSFVGERSPTGRLIDNSRVGGYLNDPRNIGFITVREDFQNATGSGLPNYNNEVVTDDLVITSGLVETNGFYAFNGVWTPQRNAGVVWLSSYADLTQNASRLKMTSRADGKLVLLWEVWTASSYVATKGMTVAANGTIVNAAADLTSHVRLGRRDDPYGLNNDIYLVAGHKADTTLELIVIETGNPGTPSATTLAATAVVTNAATLNGSANPNGLSAIGFFQWGTTTNYGQSTTAASLGSGTSAVPLSTPISGLTPGQTYHFRAAVSNSVAVVYGSDLSFTTPAAPVAPSATTLAASAVTTNAAALNGSANPNGVAAIGFFQWGTTTNYGQSTTAVNLGSGSSAVPLSTPISGLTPGQTYHFRAAASNSVSLVYGSDLTFTTTDAPLGPSATTLAATAVTSNSATLNGSANPNGLPAIGFFQWGTDIGYGQSTSPVALGSGTGAVPLSASLSWLTAGVTYHFRAAASNSVGIVYGNDLTFTPPVTFSPPISTFTGGDAGEGLDLQGTFPYALNLGGNGAPGLIGEANFTTDGAPNVTITAPGGSVNTADTWAAPTFGATANDTHLAQAMTSIRWTSYPTKLTVTLGDLLAGRSYKLQMLFIENCCDRVFDVKVNGTAVVTAFRLLDFGPFETPLAVTYTFTATGTSALIELGGGTVPPGLNGDSTLSALTLELAPLVTPAGLTITRSGNSVVIDWPAGLSGVLQESLGLAPPAWHDSPSGATHPVTLPATNPAAFYRLANLTNPRWATRVLGFSSEYSTTVWSAAQALGQPDTYPAYGDLATAWSSPTEDDSTEYLELGYDAPAPINSVSIYETYSPGAVSKISVRNPNTGLWVEVWSGTAAPAGAASRIFTVAFPQTTFPVDAIRIDLDSAAVPGFNEIDAVSITSNDNFADRTSLSGAPLTVSANNGGASKEPGEPNHTGNVGGRSLWWSWTAPSNGTVTISTAGSGIDTVMAVYTGTVLNALTQVAANDDFDGNVYSQVTFPATQNVTYLIAVDGYNFGSGAAAGAISLHLTTAP